MPHTGNADRLVHTFAIYGDQLFPELRGKLIGVNALQRRVQVTQLKPMHSSFVTAEEPFLLTCEDGRFRPVDVKVGPDGALYIADMYEPRINHVDPRDNWDKSTGRVWKIVPHNFKSQRPRDFTVLSTSELVEELKSNNRSARETAMRVLGWRCDATLIKRLQKLVCEADDRTATAAFLSIHQSALLDEETSLLALSRESTPTLRRWAIRLIGDDRRATHKQAGILQLLAKKDPDASVRSQLASSAKRLPADVALPILAALWEREEDANDPHLPMLTWWALEAHAETSRSAVLELLRDPKRRSRPVVQSVILDRLMQRWVMAGGRANLLACAALLRASQSDASRLLIGIERGFAGRNADELPAELRDAILACWDRGVSTARLTLGLRLRHGPAIQEALDVLKDRQTDSTSRLSILKVLGEVDVPEAVSVLLELLEKSPELRADCLAALARYSDEWIARKVIEWGLHRTPAGLDLLAGRVAWAKLLLSEIEAKRLEARNIPVEIVRKLSHHRELQESVQRYFGRVRPTTAKEKQAEMVRYGQLLRTGKGDAKAGAIIYENLCGKCHKLFDKGGGIGPELTGYERGNVMYWLENIVDPSAVIREEYLSFVVRTTNGQTLTGIISGQDQTTITLRDGEGRESRIARKRIEDLRADPASLMPEGQLRTLSDQQIRDLFAYLMAPTKP
ncbi:MAG: c-type cytochrome, partial [Gemmataceae bacterium]